MKNLCALPWVGFSNDPNGTVRPCCIYKEHILDKDNKPFYIQKTKVQEIFHSNYMENLREQFKNGDKPKGCAVCWEDEKNGYTSKRQSYLDIHKENVDFDKVPDYPIDYQLILTNACNLKCRSCGTSHSTSWIKELNNLPKDVSDFIEQGPYNMPHGQSGGSESVFIEDIDQWAPKVKRLEIVGGEPFYTNIWENIWNYLIEKGYSKNIVLTMSTNCTVYKPELIERLVENFDRVGISLSIDGIGDIFNFLRKNGNWEQVSQNLIKFHQLYEKLDTYRFTLNYTVTTSWVNSIILPEMTDWFKTNTPKFKIWYNLVHWPGFMCAYNIPQEIKEVVEKKLTEYNFGEYTEDIKGFINFMYSKEIQADSFTDVLKKFSALDTYRQDNSKELFIKYYPDLIKYY